MKEKNGSVKSTFFYLISNIIYKCISFITIPIFSRLMSLQEYGTVSTYLSYVTIFQVIVGLATEMSIRNAFVDYRKKMDSYVASIFMLSGINSIIIGIIVLVCNHYVFKYNSDMFCVLCVIQSFFTYIVNVMLNWYMMESNYKRRSVLMVVPNLCSVVLGLVLILCVNKERDQARIFGYVIAYAIFGVFYLYKVLWKKKESISKEYCGYALKISVPLILHTLSVSVLAQVDRIMISSVRGEAETGVYSVVYSLSMVAFAATGALQNSWLPWFTEKMKNGDFKDINKRAKAYIFEGLVITIGVMLVAPEVLKFMTTKEYWSGGNMLIPLIATSFIIYLYSFSAAIEMYYKASKKVAAITLFAAVLNIFLNSIIIPQYGALGAAYTTFVSYFVSFFLHYLDGRRLRKELYQFASLFSPILVLLVACIIVTLFKELALIRWAIAVVIGALDVVAIFIFAKREKE